MLARLLKNVFVECRLRKLYARFLQSAPEISSKRILQPSEPSLAAKQEPVSKSLLNPVRWGMGVGFLRLAPPIKRTDGFRDMTYSLSGIHVDSLRWVCLGLMRRFGLGGGDLHGSGFIP